ncbi:MAG: gliding motility protein, partial [Desulfobacterales bacterium]
MAFVNPKKKEVQVKIVYYGPGRGGKTTNLEYIYDKFSSRIKTEMVTIKTHGDRTLFFDFLPFDIGKVNGYDVKIQLYT